MGLEIAPARRMRRQERREQIVAAATRAFARSGFAATSLDDIAAEAGVSRVILYRHFESKTELYQAVLERARSRLAAEVGTGAYTPDAVAALLRAAAEEPDGFRLLFEHAAREPEFRAWADEFRATAVDVAYRQIVEFVPEPVWARWASQLAPAITIDAVIAWLDAGQPDPDGAADRILRVLGAIVQAARAQT